MNKKGTFMSGFFRSTIGKKYIMGITGLIWAGFVLAHMSGNLLIFVGADAYNSYGHLLTSGKFIYVAETVLILSFIVHVFCAISLTIQNRQAKGSQYAVQASGKKAPPKASTMMAVQGSVVLVFLIIHILTFKFGTYYETSVDGVVMRDLHRLVIEVFQSPAYVAGYVVCLILLGFHLSHGVGSIFQSFGLLERGMAPKLKKLSYTYAIVVALGFISQPIYALLLAK